MAAGQVRMFPDLPTIFWTLANLVILIAIVIGVVLAVRYLTQLSRRVRRLEDRLNQKDDE